MVDENICVLGFKVLLDMIEVLLNIFLFEYIWDVYLLVWLLGMKVYKVEKFIL